MAIKITPDEFSLLIQRLNKKWRVFAPSAEFRGGRFSDTDNIIYQRISGWRDLIWHEKSHMSPNTIIAPITETLFYFDKDTIQIAETDTSPIIVFARACDINAMSRLDYMYLSNGNNSDYSYQLLREHIRFVLIECEESFENCFCVSMGTNKTDCYSAAMRFSDEGALVSIRDPFIEAAIQGLGQEADYTPSFVSENRETVVTPDSVCRDPQKIRDILTRHPLWDAYDSRCISCGRCTTGCPTCTCYSVFDVAYDENPQRGERRRQWASCMVPGFSDMAGGHGFREKPGERLRYRALHKVNDYKARNGIEHMCVCCGRCDDRCPQYIKFSLIINKMTAAVRQALAEEA
ncbi:anaerobic sulfite reductase subunit AsrA [Salmonella sp. 741265106_PSA]|uniref:anaerobic sulfite reductase subunit AsrA n=1 Tax=unclassified Salmonella TaxID=2614656 RepID=UPI000FBD1E2F|nr:anaerobic sulfite reductase subunit A [Salmonella enterica subsp. enterica serovar Poona]ELH0398552.1 anaerobic sulfite reductase subunit A [Salmonella enterica]EBV4982679.1 anaerobic sulfite reductase subunit A [Salmonella enterica subsp. enterica serovar Poona]EBX5147499.1 anaerobic sulfite reductase subunit A [Salmonella enterica subsp. enterica serovar Poona]ECG5495988.1 anaerobic sulfite reductase subunit A [Salmonella enterica subsp. enterica serovar Poona]